MAICTAELIQAYYTRFTSNEDRTPVVVVASLVVTLLTYYFFTKNGLISGVELVGVRRHSLSYMKAKRTFITQGRKLILDAVKKVCFNYFKRVPRLTDARRPKGHHSRLLCSKGQI